MSYTGIPTQIATCTVDLLVGVGCRGQGPVILVVRISEVGFVVVVGMPLHCWPVGYVMDWIDRQNCVGGLWHVLRLGCVGGLMDSAVMYAIHISGPWIPSIGPQQVCGQACHDVCIYIYIYIFARGHFLGSVTIAGTAP